MSTPGELLRLALAGDATAAAELWRMIDAEKVDDATAAAWARSVATQVVTNVLNPDIPANRARENARAALGLEGRVDRMRELRELVQEFPEATAGAIANAADLVIDVGGLPPEKIKRQVHYIRQRKEK